MEGSWKAKCSSTLQFSGPPVASSSSQELRNQSRGYYSYSYGSEDSRPTMLGRLQDPLFASVPCSGSHRSEHATLGNSFLDFLYGSSPVVHSGFQELSNLKPIGTSCKLMSNGNNFIVNGIGSAISSGLASENRSGKSLQGGTYSCPSVSSKAIPSSSFANNSVWHDLRSSDLANVINCDLVPSSEKVKGSVSLSGEWRGIIPVDTGKACREIVQTSKEMPVEANSSSCNQASSFMNGCPRVFCSTTSGFLLLSNTGLVGIVCSCHCLHMSVFNFCEHSGLYDVNPGESVCMDTGETIAQWCKHYFLKSGIRVPEDRSEWDWPVALSATAGLVKSSETTPYISCNLSHMVHSHGAPTRSRESFDSVSQSQSVLTNQSYVGSVKDKQQRNSKDGNNIFLKGVTSTSRSNLHGMTENPIFEQPPSMSKLPVIGLEGSGQSISAYCEPMNHRNSGITCPTMKNEILSFTLPSIQEGRTMGKESDFYRTANEKNAGFRDAAISSIELRLGQPYQFGQTSGNSNLSAIGPLLLDTLVNPLKSFYPEQMIPNTNCREDVEFRQSRHISSPPSNARGKRDRNQLNHGNNAFVFGTAIDAARVEKSNRNLAWESVTSLANFNDPPEDNTLQNSNKHIYTDGEHGMQNMLRYEPRSGNYDLANVLQDGSNSVGRKFGMSHVGSCRLIDKANGVHYTTDDSHLSKNLGIRKEKEISSSVNELSGSSNSLHFFTAQANSCYSRQLSGVPPDGPDDRRYSNFRGKVLSFGNSEQVDHVNLLPLASSRGSGVTFLPQAVSKDFPVNASTTVLNQTSASSREELLKVRTHFPENSSQLFAWKKTLKLSKQEQALPSFPMTRGEGRFGSFVQNSFVEASSCGKQGQQLSRAGKNGVSEDTIKSHQSCRVGSDEGFMTGVSTCCNFSSLKQGNALYSEEVDLKHQISFVPLCDEQPSVRRSRQNITEPGEHERCYHSAPYSYFHGSCSCAVKTNSLGRTFESRDKSLPNSCKEKIGTVNHAPMHESFSLDQRGKFHQKEGKNACHSSQWKDVPSKVKAVSDVTRVDHLANLFDARRQDDEQPGDTSVKCFNGTVQTLDSPKEYEISNNSSAPAVTNISNMGSLTVDVGDNGCTSNLIVDEGSGNHRCWSSDDALESKKSSEFSASTGNTSLSKVESYKDLNNQKSCSLLDELKLLNSLTWRKGQNQTPAGLDHHEKHKRPQNFDRGLKTGKEMRETGLETCTTSGLYLLEEENHKCHDTAQNSSCPSKGVKMIFPVGQLKTRTLGACDTQFSSKPTLPISSSVKKLSRKRDLCTLYDDNNREVYDAYHTVPNGGTEKCGIVGVSGGKKCRKDFSRQFQIQESSHEDARKSKYNSLKSSSQQVSVCYRKARPVVCGNYGELSNGSLAGDLPKPAKLVPLSKVLNSARRCMIPRKFNAKSTSKKKLKKTSPGGAVAGSGMFYHMKTDRDNKCHYGRGCGKINDNCMEKMKKECSIGDKKFRKDLSLLEEGEDDSEQDHIKLDSIAHAQSKPKNKEIRKRSIYELTDKGKDPGFESSTLPNCPTCLPAKKEGKLIKTDEDVNLGLCKLSAKNSTLEQQCHSVLDSDAFCCVCGSSKKDEINDLLECSHCSIRVHQASYGVPRLPEGRCRCRPCQASAEDIGQLASEAEIDYNKNIGFYGRCGLHATQGLCELNHDDPAESEVGHMVEEGLTCARTEGYKGRKRDGLRNNYYDQSKGNGGCLVKQEQLNAWVHINRHKSFTQVLPKQPISDIIDHDCRKEYARYKQAKFWKHLAVYKSGIHALGLYTSRFISRDEMVVEYVGEIVGQRVADKRENEYQSGRRLQYKSACYFFRIDKEHVVDATCKGGIARFVNHSCMPNCIAKVISVRNEKKVVLLAERDIFPGEEITYDYHFNHEEEEGNKIPCSCNSNNCRHYLN